jgi:endonuclease YncB( thermonuclease family)
MGVISQVGRITTVMLLCAPLLATSPAPPVGLTLDGEIVRVIDGDTLVIQSSIEYQVRLIDCWAPEIRTRDAHEKARGIAARDRMAELAPVGQSVRVHVPGRQSVVGMISFGRLLGRVWRLEDGEPAEPDLSAVMVSEGFARRTKGGDE